MLWAFRAHAQAKVPWRMSLVTFNQHAVTPQLAETSTASAAALGELLAAWWACCSSCHVSLGLACTGWHWISAATSCQASMKQELRAGLARTVFMETRYLYATSLDLAPSALPSLQQLLHMAAASGEYAAAFRAGRVYALRLMPAQPVLPRISKLHKAGTCIVSGGTKARPIIVHTCCLATAHLVCPACR